MRTAAALFARLVWYCLRGVALALLPLLLAHGSQAQAPTLTARSPARNLPNAPRPANVVLTFDQALDPATAGSVRVFGGQRGGQLVRGGNATASGNVLTVNPARDFEPGETIFTTVPATVVGSGGASATPAVYQFTAAAGAGPGTFSGTANVPVGPAPRSVAVADVDGDGDVDLLTVSNNSSGSGNAVRVRRNDGTGSFSGTVGVAVADGSECIAVADVDGDGDLDALVTGTNSASVRVLTNNGTGTFRNTATVSVGTSPFSVVAADVDGDGDLDLLTANNDNTVSVRFNNGTGAFGGSATVPVGNGPFSVVAADVDGDDDLDLLTANYSSNTVSVRRNNGSGTFSGPAGSPADVPVGRGPFIVVAADVDGDGDLDLLTANSNANTVSVRFNDGLGRFSGTADVLVGSGPLAVAAGDVDGDGDLDLLTANSDANTVSVRRNNGSGIFSGPAGGGSDVPVGSTPVSLAVADVDGDSDLDILAANIVGNDVSVRFNQVAGPDLVISTGSVGSPVGVAAGTYNSIIITDTGVGQLAGAVVVNGAVVVRGRLDTVCQPLTGTASFALEAGGTLGICDPAGIDNFGPGGAVRVIGSRSFSPDASYVYDGAGVRITGTGLPPQVRNLTVTTPNSLFFLGGDVRVAQVLTVGGNVTLIATTQRLTLLSEASGTALVVNEGRGTVLGNVVVQRYLDTPNPGLGYRHYASPVSGNLLSSLATGSFAPVFNPAYNSSAASASLTPFPTVFGYDQGRLGTAPSAYTGFDQGWFSPAGSDAFLPGVGYAVQLPGTEQVAFTGTLNTGNYARTLARSPGSTGGEGLHLVGNPYPAPLDWSAVLPADRPGLDGAMYVFESTGPYTGAYRSYANGVGAGNPLIAAGQGFFVRVTPGQASGTLTFKNSQRKTSFADQVAMGRGTADTRPQLRLTLAGAGSGAGAGAADDVFIYAQAGATASEEAEFDAAKLPNPTGLNLASLTAGGAALAIDGRADFGAATRLPLGVQVPAAGRYTLTATALANLAGTRAELVDNLTGTRTVLVPGAAYGFALTTTTAPGRFWLNLAPAAGPLASASAALEAQVLAYPNPARGSFTVLRPLGAKVANALLMNALGQTVQALALPTAETAVDVRGLPTGIYTLRLTLDGQPVVRRVVVE